MSASRLQWPAVSADPAGEVVAIHHYREAEREHAPAIIGSGAFLAASNDDYKTRPCGFRLGLLPKTPFA